MESVVGEKGQVTIPKRLRDSLGITAGSRLDFEEHQGTLLVRKARAGDRIGSIVGILSGEGLDVDKEIEAARGPALFPPRGRRWGSA